MSLQGVPCQYDTLIHRHIAPGATYTQFQFNNINLGTKFPYKMRVHLVTIDMTNQYNDVSTYLAKDTYYAINSQEQEVARQKSQGLKPVASVNGYGFAQSYEAGDTNGPYEVFGTFITNNAMKYADSDSQASYYTDENKRANVATLTMNACVKTSSGTSAQIGQINHYRDHARNANQLALFCNGMEKAHDTQPEQGVEVLFDVINSKSITIGRNNLKVKKIVDNCGNTPIGKGQAILTGVGDQAVFLNSLTIGEEVSVDINYSDERGISVNPANAFTAFIQPCISQGVVSYSSMENTAFPATGVTKDGKTLFWADLEISKNSNAPTRCFEDFLLNIGSWNAFFHDGGPSAEMTIDGKFVTVNSIGNGFNGRYIPSGLMLYSIAPDDSRIVSVECEDPSLRKVRLNEQFSIQLFGFNQYGEMIDADAINNESVEVKCTPAIGTISNGVFIATQPGNCNIEITVKGSNEKLSIPVTVLADNKLILSPKTLFTGENRAVQIKAKLHYDGTEIELNPQKVKWTTDNDYVVSSCANGLIVPKVDGFARVFATYGEFKDTLEVTVENLEVAGTTTLDLTNQLPASTTLDMKLPSVPRSLYLETQTTTSDSATLWYSTGSTEHTHQINSNGSTHRDTIVFDYDAPDTYPVILSKLTPISGVTITKLIAQYGSDPSSIEAIESTESPMFSVKKYGQEITITNLASAIDVSVSAYQLSGIRIFTKKVHLAEGESFSFRIADQSPLIIHLQTLQGDQIVRLLTQE